VATSLQRPETDVVILPAGTTVITTYRSIAPSWGPYERGQKLKDNTCIAKQ